MIWVTDPGHRWLCERRQVASRAERRGNRAEVHEYGRRRRDRPRGWPSGGVRRPPGWPPRGWRR
ncbi:hypothetical protein [Amycolatopsis eburnea]|uniref:Uncharacterized protein n=1 Tax=Amycolatopsis eburnea TaxID=2267691 RepID=A0A3R9FME1_9PSEU|nr:hypothetical protein [Amycolatopsis eburnea]RSD17206.1 hypothetical protein EIY87_20735 [Amycolatopsis eburnea]